MLAAAPIKTRRWLLAAGAVIGVAVVGVGFGVPSGSATFAGKNGRIAFDAKLSGDSEIYTVLPSGKGRRTLTANALPDHSPSFGPRGKRLVYTSASITQIFTMNDDGSDRHQLTHNSKYNLDPSYSPDGKTVVFDQTPYNSHFKLVTVRVDGTGEHDVTDGSTNAFDPVYSPDGKWIVFDTFDGSSAQVMEVHPDGTGQRLLADHATNPSFSPNGHSILFTNQGGGIQVMHADGTHRQDLHVPGYKAVYSPDGNEIAYLRQKGHTASSALWVMRANASHQRVVVSKLPYETNGPSLSWGSR
jgi:Tol biopolymer transport system component